MEKAGLSGKIAVNLDLIFQRMKKLYQQIFMPLRPSSASRMEGKAWIGRALLCTAFFLGAVLNNAKGQTYYTMSSGNYLEDFNDIANTTNWPNGFNGPSSTEWRGLAVNATGTIPDGVRLTAATNAAFVTGTTAGIQRGTNNVQFLTNGTPQNTSSAAIELYLDFTGRNAGTLSFDAATVFNNTGDRVGSLRVYTSTDGVSYTELTGTGLPYVATNNVTGSASISSIALPATFNGAANARIRFYYHNGNANGTAGSRPKISLDNVSVTSTAIPVTPTITPSPTSLTGLNYVFGSGPSASQSFTISAVNLTAGGGNITFDASATDYEVSVTSPGTAGFGSSVSLPYTGTGTLANNTVWVRLKSGLAAATYNSQSIAISGGGATSSVTASGTVSAASPVITPSPATLTGFTYVLGSGPSASQSFTIAASNLTAGGGNITFSAASTDYEVSVTSPGTAGFASSVTLPYTGTGTLANNTVWVRLKSGLAVNSYNGQTISISGGGGSSSVTVSGSVTPIPYMQLTGINVATSENMNGMGNVATATLPTGFRIGTDWSAGTTATTVSAGTTGAGIITTTGGTYNFGNGLNSSATDRALGFLTTGTFTSPKSIVLAVQNTTGATVDELVISFDYEKYRFGTRAFDWNFFHGSSPVPATAAPAGDQSYAADANSTTVLNPPTTISKNFSITGLSIPNGGVYYLMWTFTGVGGSTNGQAIGIDNVTIIPTNATAPGFTLSTSTITGLSYPFGAGPSAESTLTISGDNLTGNVVITPPTNFEISLTSGSGFVSAPSTLTVNQSGGNIVGEPRNLYVRLKSGLAIGTYNNEVFNAVSAGAVSRTLTASGTVAPALVTLSASAASGSEAGTTLITLTATASGPLAADETVDVTVSGTGITAGDYTITDADPAPGIQIKILAGNSTGSINFTIQDDNLNEGTETATITISNPSSGLGVDVPNTVNVAINDDDDAIRFTVLNTAPATVTFDDLANTGTTNTLNIKGAYMLELGSSSNTFYAADNGSGTGGGSISYGTTATSDRALGSLASNNVSPIYFGLKLTNNTGVTMNAIDLTYTGEQWRNGGNTSADNLFFEFSTNATSLTTGTWNQVNTLNMVSLQNTATAAALNGNSPANRSIINSVLGLGNIANGNSVWIRWRDENLGGNDHGMGVDDVIMVPQFITPSIFYSKSTGDLNDLTTWGDNPDGSGNNPANFTAAGQTFNVVNNAAPTISAPWTVSGATSKVVVGNGIDPVTFTVPAGSAFTGVVDISAQAALVLNDASTPTFGTINSNSSVTFGATSGTQNVDAVAYGNLTFSGAGIKNITGPLSVAGNLVFNGATMNKSAAGFVNMTYAGNISVLAACTFQAGFTTNVSLVTSGNGNQTIFGNGNELACSQFNSLTKTAGSLVLSTVGGTTTITTQDDIKLNMPAGTSFVDNGNNLNVGGDFETAGVVASYTLTGTLTLNGNTAAAVNIRQDGTGGSGAVGVAELNNVVINCGTSNQVNFQPILPGTGSTLIKGNLTIQGASAYTNGIRFGSTSTSNGVRLRGNYNNTLSGDVIFPNQGTLVFQGTAAQTYTTAATTGDGLYNVIVNNSNGVSMSGDMRITGSGNLTCTSGILTTNAATVVLSSTATLTESLTSYVLGNVSSTRTPTPGLNAYGNMGLELTVAGTLPGSTVVSRETGVSYALGCSGASVKRKFTVTPTVNAGLNVTLTYKYAANAFELNGLDENYFTLFSGGGPWSVFSPTAVLDAGNNSIIVSGLTSIAGAYVASIPNPTLGSLTTSQVYTCDDSSNVLQLNGMVGGGTFRVRYTKGLDAPVLLTLTANPSGLATHTLTGLTNADNGAVVTIDSIAQVGTGCYILPSSNNTTTLDVRPRPTVVINANDFVCQDQTAPLEYVFKGSPNWTMDYTINNVVQTQLNTASNTVSQPYVNATVARTYSIKRVVDANCPVKSGTLTDFVLDVPIPCSISWNGSVSSDWNDKDNWTPNNAAPSSKTSVVLKAAPNQPNIASPVPAAVCANIILQAGAAPVIGAGNTISIRGDLNGSFDNVFNGAGKVVLNGTGAQTVTGTVRLGNVDFANTSPSGVIVANGGTLEIGPGYLATFLPNSRVTVNGTGTLKLASNASATAKIGPIPTSAIINGEITQERYLPYTNTGTGRWYFLGSPFSGKNFTNWADNFKVVGLSTGFGVQGGDVISSPEPERSTIFKYDEPNHHIRLDTVQKQGWKIPGNENIAVGNGYRVWVSSVSNASHKFDSRGTITRNDFTFPTLTRNEAAGCIPATFPCNEPALRGWNLLANPYPCDIDWDATGGVWTKPAQMNNAFYTWNANAGGYRAYLGTTGTPGVDLGVTLTGNTNPNIIPSSQAFFVRLTSAGSYTTTMSVKEGAKVTTSAGTFTRTATASNGLRVRMKNNSVSDYQFDAMIRLADDATDGFDHNQDLHLLAGDKFHFGWEGNNETFLLNTIPGFTDTKVIPMSVDYQGSTSGNFSFEFMDASTLGANVQVWLKDNYLNSLTPVLEGDVVEYTVPNADAAAKNRFELVLTTESVTSVAGISKGVSMSILPNPSQSAAQTQVRVNGWNSESAVLEVTDALGRVIRRQTVSAANGKLDVQMPMNLTSGVYLVKITGANQSIARRWVVK